ncbi:hypothetical protein ACQUW5_03775 [Legionella sp. CNM-1927-20]|uniref:hypothetical protein n=1 Tax=Legionella sp. CNM-1927-20 TaxID=3422221 RepID=UPI00403AB858
MDAETKINAVNMMLKALDPKNSSPVDFSSKMLDALRDGKLGKIIENNKAYLPESFTKAVEAEDKNIKARDRIHTKISR